MAKSVDRPFRTLVIGFALYKRVARLIQAVIGQMKPFFIQILRCGLFVRRRAEPDESEFGVKFGVNFEFIWGEFGVNLGWRRGSVDLGHRQAVRWGWG
jgi:hypothetical protein